MLLLFYSWISEMETKRSIAKYKSYRLLQKPLFEFVNDLPLKEEGSFPDSKSLRRKLGVLNETFYQEHLCLQEALLECTAKLLDWNISVK